MFDTIDAALYYPPNGHIYFFKGLHYLKYRFGHGVVLLSGREVRTIGVDGWRTFPEEFRADIDAALFYPPNGRAYFFKGPRYISYVPGSGVASSPVLRNIGDGWSDFPDSFAEGIDAALFHPDNDYAYFFKGSRYIKYDPESELVERIGSRKIRNIGDDGWWSFPDSFRARVDAAIGHPPSGKCYFFRGREYLRWQPNQDRTHGVDPRYPRRLGLPHRDQGGWPGLSHVIAGPLVSSVTDHTAKIWIWMTDEASADGLQVMLNGSSSPFTTLNPVSSQIAAAVAAINAESQIRVLELNGLSPATNYTARITLGAEELDAVTFTTAPAASSTGRVVIAFGSCSDMSKSARDLPTFAAMNRHQPDLALLCGDNCYYVNKNGTTSITEITEEENDRPRDWESTELMLRRQVEARNHPQFTALSRSVPLYSTWDDHDFGYNNAGGTDLTDDWVGRGVATDVFRAMWPNPYQTAGTDQPIFYSFRWGPVEVFMTDSRFYRHKDNKVIWGKAQLRWLIRGLIDSRAPLKIVVTAGQFLFNPRDEEGHPNDAPDERQAVLDHLLGSSTNPPSISGRVLFLSGDMHYSELLRLPGTGPAATLEFTSSPMRRNEPKLFPEAVAGSRIWGAERNGFGVVAVDIQANSPDGPADGTVTLEAWAVEEDESSSLMVMNRQTCRSTWDLATGIIT